MNIITTLFFICYTIIVTLNSWNKKQKCKIKMSSTATSHLFYSIIKIQPVPDRSNTARYTFLVLLLSNSYDFVKISEDVTKSFLSWTYSCDKVMASGYIKIIGESNQIRHISYFWIKLNIYRWGLKIWNYHLIKS